MSSPPVIVLCTQNVLNIFIKRDECYNKKLLHHHMIRHLRNLKLYARSLQEGTSTMAKISVTIEKTKS